MPNVLSIQKEFLPLQPQKRKTPVSYTHLGGYDRTPSELTEKLIEEGAAIHYEENTGLITDAFRNPARCV